MGARLLEYLYLRERKLILAIQIGDTGLDMKNPNVLYYHAAPKRSPPVESYKSLSAERSEALSS